MKIEKSCYVCKKTYSALTVKEMSQYFGKWSYAVDGLLGRCKPCNRNLHATYRAANKKKEVLRVRRYELLNKHAARKEQVRSATRTWLGSASRHRCAECSEPAHHWHHREYSTFSVIALCRSCHVEEHRR